MDNGVIFWIIMAVVLGFVESMTASLVSIWGAVAAVICAILASFRISYEIVSVCFIAITAILLLATRPLAKKLLNSKTVATNADRIIGSEARVIKKITPDASGQVDIRGQIWTAYEKDSNELEIGDRVRVVSIEGVKAIVEKI